MHLLRNSAGIANAHQQCWAFKATPHQSAEPTLEDIEFRSVASDNELCEGLGTIRSKATCIRGSVGYVRSHSPHVDKDPAPPTAPADNKAPGGGH
jgi:hypothetical protein